MNTYEYDDISDATFSNWSLRPLPPNDPTKYTFVKWEKKYRYHLNRIYNNIQKYSNKNNIQDFLKNFNYTNFCCCIIYF